ncbi:MAG: endonuclease/exonuclease/phosphatase family protein [Bryobacterales bacterium]|nr:endonuclease/exonuclease/phosphatase family protein [Bryobacterales bacterium]
MRLLCLILLTLSTLVSASAESLRVMSFNIRMPNYIDAINYWDSRRDLAIKMIRQEAPDIIGTQETYFRQGNDIVTALPEYVWLGNSRQAIHTDEYMAVFFRKERFELLEMGQFWLSETPNKPASMSWGVDITRMVTWVRFLDKRTQKPFYFLDTHLAHRSQDEQARSNSAKIIADFVEKLPKDVPVILTGDFNTTPEHEAYKILTAHLKDAWLASAERVGPTGTFHAFRGGENPEPRIDWILYRAPWKVRRMETVTMHEGRKYPSDHYPVVADFEIQ